MVAILMKELQEILNECKQEDTADNLEEFNLNAETTGTGVYLCTAHQRIPIVINNVHDLNEKMKQMTSDYSLILDGKLIDEKTDIKSIYKFASIKVHSRSIKLSKISGQGETHLSEEKQQLKYNQKFMSGLENLIAEHVHDADDKKLVLTTLKTALDKL